MTNDPSRTYSDDEIAALPDQWDAMQHLSNPRLYIEHGAKMVIAIRQFLAERDAMSDERLKPIRARYDEWAELTSPDEPSGLSNDDYRDRAIEAHAEIGILLMWHYQQRTQIAQLRAELDAAKAAIEALQNPTMTTREEFRRAWKEATAGKAIPWEDVLKTFDDDVTFGRGSEGE